MTYIPRSYSLNTLLFWFTFTCVIFSVQIHCKTAVQLPSHSKITHVNMWVLLCGVSIGCRWENSANFSLESFSYLQIDKGSNKKRHSNSCKILKLLLYTIFFPYKTYLAVSYTVQGKSQKTLKKERQVFKISLFFYNRFFQYLRGKWSK